MVQTNYIKFETIEQMKCYIKSLYEQRKPISVRIKTPRSKQRSHDAQICGVYQSFFTVKDTKLNIAFTINYIDVIMGAIELN